LRFLLSVEAEKLGDNVTDMIASSTDENLLLMTGVRILVCHL